MISWRVWLVSIASYASLYAYKRATHSPERDVKDQVKGKGFLSCGIHSSTTHAAGEACGVKVEQGESDHMSWLQRAGSQ